MEINQHGPRYEYNKIHKWLIRIYGKATHCESLTCKGECKVFDYALIKGQVYSQDRSKFSMLCRSCHVKYDERDDTIEKKASFHRGRKRGLEARKNMSDAAIRVGRIPPSRKGKKKNGTGSIFSPTA